MFLEWKLRKIRLKEQKKLHNENLVIYKNMTSYIQKSNLTLLEKEEILQQIMDMLLQAQLEDKDINLFIGNDYEQFCKSIEEEYLKSKSSLYKFLHQLQKYLIYLILILGLRYCGNLFNHEALSLNIEDFLSYNMFALLALIGINISKKRVYAPIYPSIISAYKYPLILATLFPFSIALLRFCTGTKILGFNLIGEINIILLTIGLIGIALIEAYKKLNSSYR